MRTTINIEEGLLAEAKHRAAQRGTTLMRLIEDSLRQELSRRENPDEGPFASLTLRGGGLMPGVDLDDSAALRDMLDEGGPWSSRASTS